MDTWNELGSDARGDRSTSSPSNVSDLAETYRLWYSRTLTADHVHVIESFFGADPGYMCPAAQATYGIRGLFAASPSQVIRCEQ